MSIIKGNLPIKNTSIVRFDEGETPLGLSLAPQEDSLAPLISLKDIFNAPAYDNLFESIENNFTIYNYFMTISIKPFIQHLDLEKQINLFKQLFKYLEVNYYTDFRHYTVFELYSDFKNVHTHTICNINTQSQATKLKKLVVQFLDLKGLTVKTTSAIKIDKIASYKNPSILKLTTYLEKQQEVMRETYNVNPIKNI